MKQKINKLNLAILKVLQVKAKLVIPEMEVWLAILKINIILHISKFYSINRSWDRKNIW